MYALDVSHLSRTFTHKDTVVSALDDVSFHVGRGECVALLGRNGAGKTTLTKIAATLLLPTSGTISLMGTDVVRDPAKARRYASVVFGGDRGFYPMLNAYQNLSYSAALVGLYGKRARSKAEDVLHTVGLAGDARRPVEQYSKGMRQRLHIATAMLKDAPIMLLDEPTVGLDPLEAKRLRESIRDSVHEGMTVLLTSHNLGDVEALASRVLLLDQGTMKIDASLDEFRAAAGFAATVTATVPHSALGRLTTAPITAEQRPSSSDPDYTDVTFHLKDWGRDSLSALSYLKDIEGIRDIEVRTATLDESFSHYFREGS